MRAHMARVTSLRNRAIGVLGAIGIDRVGAVVFLVGLAVVAGEVSADLGADADAVADLQVLDLGAGLYDFTDDLVTHAEGERDVLAPAAGDGVDV